MSVIQNQRRTRKSCQIRSASGQGDGAEVKLNLSLANFGLACRNVTKVCQPLIIRGALVVQVSEFVFVETGRPQACDGHQRMSSSIPTTACRGPPHRPEAERQVDRAPDLLGQPLADAIVPRIGGKCGFRRGGGDSDCCDSRVIRVCQGLAQTVPVTDIFGSHRQRGLRILQQAHDRPPLRIAGQAPLPSRRKPATESANGICG